MTGSFNLSLYAEAIMQRFSRIPAWVTVLATAAVVGSISAMVSVTALARYQRDRPALEVPVQEIRD